MVFLGRVLFWIIIADLQLFSYFFNRSILKSIFLRGFCCRRCSWRRSWLGNFFSEDAVVDGGSAKCCCSGWPGKVDNWMWWLLPSQESSSLAFSPFFQCNVWLAARKWQQPHLGWTFCDFLFNLKFTFYLFRKKGYVATVQWALCKHWCIFRIVSNHSYTMLLKKRYFYLCMTFFP